MRMRVRGFKEVDEALVRIGSVAGTKAMRASMFVAVKPIVLQAQDNIRRWPGGSGALHLAIGRKFYIGNPALSASAADGKLFTVQIGARRKAPAAISLYNLHYRRKKARRGIIHGHFQEFSHRIVTRGGKSHGMSVAKPFLRPALTSAGPEAVKIFRTEISKRVDRAIKKLDVAAEKV